MGMHLRQRSSLSDTSVRIALATLPLLLMWVINTGYQSRVLVSGAQIQAVPAWRALILSMLENNTAPDWLLGLAYFLPLLAVSCMAVFILESLFAVARRRPVEPGWYLPPWLFVLLIPAGITLPQAFVAIGVGVTLGKLVFGGTGKYLVSPVLVAVLFLFVAHPEAFLATPQMTSLQHPAVQTAWGSLADGGVAVLTATGASWWDMFLGRGISIFGSTSSAACLSGAVYLMLTGTISWRILAGGLAGLIFAAFLANAFSQVSVSSLAALPWYWHSVSGAFAFGLVFLAADPGAAPLTRGGRWFLGFVSGCLVVAIRVLDPAHPEGTLHAILLAALFAPLADHVAVRFAIDRRAKRVAAWL
jgi:Na+-transporting NADH:ubiquinone oxidoreductase subunit B